MKNTKNIISLGFNCTIRLILISLCIFTFFLILSFILTSFFYSSLTFLVLFFLIFDLTVQHVILICVGRLTCIITRNCLRILHIFQIYLC